MAKGLKPTGRRTFKKRFTNKFARFNKRVSAQTWRTTSLVARTLYPPLPAQMKLSLRLQQYSLHQLGQNDSVIIGVSGISPVGVGNNTYAEGFAAMMRLYSHAIVDRIQVTFGVIPTDQEPATAGRNRPFPVTSLVIPWTDFNGIAAVLPDQILSYPDAKTKMLGTQQAERETTFYHSVDVRKALSNPHEEHYATRSTPAGIITTPALNANIGSSPMVCLYASTTDPNFGRYFYLRRDIVYHITFSMRHTTSTNNLP